MTKTNEYRKMSLNNIIRKVNKIKHIFTVITGLRFKTTIEQNQRVYITSIIVFNFTIITILLLR